MNRRPTALPPIPAQEPETGFADTGCATIQEWQREIHASRPTVEKLIKLGLPHFDIGTAKKRCIRIPRAAALAWLRHRSNGGTP